MKKQFLVLVAALFITMGAAFAQGPQRMTVDERVALAMDKIEAGLKPSETVKASVKTVIVDFYTKQQKAMEEMRASGSMDREKMMELRKKLAEERDTKLKAIFTAEQMTKWTNEIEPGLRPQRREGDSKQ
ncbi:MAG: hypothetical protein EOP53_25550 [Sphingobacteriales bacterium]|nr:MAG: hypothetical protein EOP53_25550 [Sphingobacteriales bacterium]